MQFVKAVWGEEEAAVAGGSQPRQLRAPPRWGEGIGRRCWVPGWKQLGAMSFELNAAQHAAVSPDPQRGLYLV